MFESPETPEPTETPVQPAEGGDEGGGQDDGGQDDGGQEGGEGGGGEQ